MSTLTRSTSSLRLSEALLSWSIILLRCRRQVLSLRSIPLSLSDLRQSFSDPMLWPPWPAVERTAAMVKDGMRLLGARRVRLVGRSLALGFRVSPLANSSPWLFLQMADLFRGPESRLRVP
jgi:hypothetical protein